MTYQPKTGQPCGCRPGKQRDNCPECEGTGQVIDFRKIRYHSTMQPKLTYQRRGDAEYSTIGGNTIEIHTSGDGAYRAMLNAQLLPANPVYSTPDAAKLAAERCVLEMARTIVEILG